MKKTAIILLLCVVWALPASAKPQMLEGKVTYTVESARELAFEGIPRTIKVSEFEGHMQDPDRKENLSALKNGTVLKNRSVQLFKGMVLRAYAVTYFDNPKYTYYYIKGINQLVFTDIDELDIKDKNIKYPLRTMRYDFRGRLIAVGIYVSDEERFLYKENGELISHWIGDVGYNAKGRKIGTIEEISF